MEEDMDMERSTSGAKIIFREIPPPKKGELACPGCGGELQMSGFTAINHKDPDRSVVILHQSMFDGLTIEGVMPGAEMVHQPATQGVMVLCTCDHCCSEPGLLGFGISYEPDGRTRFYWRYPAEDAHFARETEQV
jgi:hypothetical protein